MHMIWSHLPCLSYCTLIVTTLENNNMSAPMTMIYAMHNSLMQDMAINTSDAAHQNRIRVRSMHIRWVINVPVWRTMSCWWCHTECTCSVSVARFRFWQWPVSERLVLKFCTSRVTLNLFKSFWNIGKINYPILKTYVLKTVTSFVICIVWQFT